MLRLQMLKVYGGNIKHRDGNAQLSNKVRPRDSYHATRKFYDNAMNKVAPRALFHILSTCHKEGSPLKNSTTKERAKDRGYYPQ